MASSKSSTKKKSAPAPKKSAGAAKKTTTKAAPPKSAPAKSAPAAPQPVRREIWGVVFLFLAVIAVLSHYNQDGAFVAFFSNFLKGLVGYGFWVVPVAFVLCTFVLFTHKGRPVDGRITCALLLPVFFSAIMELSLGLTPADGLEFQVMVGKLFWNGQDMISGGVIGGLLARALEAAFSVYGAMPLLVVLFLCCVVFAFRGSFRGLFKSVKLERRPYDPAAYVENEKFTVPELLDERGVPVGKPAKPIERVDRRTYTVDLPLGEDEEPLTLTGPSAAYEDSYIAPAKTRSRAKVRRKATEEPAPAVQEEIPVSKEPAEIPGFDLEESCPLRRRLPRP